MPPNSVPLRPSWVEVNLNAIEHNTRRLTEIIGPSVELMAMVKANAYGHGAVEVSRAALRGGAKWLGVYSVGEGIELRRAEIDTPILVAAATPPRWARDAVAHNLSLTVFSMDGARAIADAARELSVRARVHVKVDTGMTRLGVTPDQASDFVRAVRDLPNLELEGVFTHFAMADDTSERGKEYTRMQLERFHHALDELERQSIHVHYRHAANSPAALNLDRARFNLVRSGILIYGLDPSPKVPHPRDFVPALSFKTEIASIKSVPAGTYVGYGATFRTPRTACIAVLMVGYADGFRRTPKNFGEVLVCGKRAPITGRVSMDQTMIDVTDIPDARVGAEVVLIGKQGAEEILAEEVAEKLGTNNYEVVSTISARVLRVYKV